MNYDIIIIGAGLTGCTAALALARTSTLQIAVMDAKPISDFSSSRVSAISLASQSILQHLGVWEKIIAKEVSPYSKMHVWDSESTGEIHFDAKEIEEETLGFIIPDAVIHSSLLEKCRECPTLHFFSPVQLISWKEKMDGVELATKEDRLFSAKLIIAADGAKSWARHQAKMTVTTMEYDHTAIVSTVKTTLPHQRIARQRFLPSGPLAFLPLADPYTCSIVWSCQKEKAEKLLSLDEKIFCDELGDALDNTLGKITQATARLHFPLRRQHAKKYVHPHLALIGDAAHTIHPLAGQGVNLGLLDAACLAEVITNAITKRRDYSAVVTLRKYERWRKNDTVIMLQMIDIVKRLFESESTPIQYVRQIGLHLIHRTPFAKHFLMKYALGKRKDLPKMAMENR